MGRQPQSTEQDEQRDDRHDREQRGVEERVADRVQYLLVHVSASPPEYLAAGYPARPHAKRTSGRFRAQFTGYRTVVRGIVVTLRFSDDGGIPNHPRYP